MKYTSKILASVLCLFLLVSCSNEDDNVPPSTNDDIFERDFVSFNYVKNTSDNSKIDISTVINVKLDADELYPNGLFLVVTQNFRHKNSFGTFSPSTHVDTLFIANHTEKDYTISDQISYINSTYIIENPEVIIHDRNFSFYTP